ncbi:uncharacterized protein ARMOST_12947 [Armillaria ostoyae]|uniref:Retrotransposon gag domain-containing protein n=1 Tax=Armillaria ostoyae TaxID=47428 RepID=A0A284RLD8_ARMOS|nr:uncharacterized protein ARMOST_12947 [Armillaria ostoyae]
MTPDELTIVIVGTIGGTCLLSLLFSIIVLANAKRIRRLLHIETLAPTIPAHYVLPYVQPGPLMEPVGQIHTSAPQRRATYPTTSSDDDVPLPPRNATPSLSNVPRTPPPTYDPAETEEYGRFLRSIFRSPTPELPLITIPDSPETPVWALLPEPDDQAPRPTTPVHHQRLPGTLHTGGIRIGTPAHLCPLPDSDSDDENSDSSDYGGNEPVAERENDDPLNPHGLDYEHGSSDGSTSSSEAGSKDPETESGWGGTSPSPEDHQFQDEEGTQTYVPASMRTAFAPSIAPPPETASRTFAPALPRNKPPSPTYYSHSPWPRETAPTSTVPPDFDNFNQDPETFGWADEEEEMDTALYDGDYRGYTTAPHFYHQPFPLPDSPTYAGEYQTPQPPHPRHPPEPVEPTAGPSQPSNEERLEAAHRQSETNRREYNVLKAQMEAAQAKMMMHDVTWDFMQPPDKGKEPDRGRPVIPNYRRPLYDRTDRWSVPRPPPRWQVPNPYPAPVGAAPNDAPWLGVKPVMVKTPLPFDGKYDDVERFVGDCFTYFEVFATYFQVPSSRVVFAATHLEGTAKDWWVHARQDFWANHSNDPNEPRFRFPSWGEFTTLLAQNFHDPASEELHEKRMFDL